jgi:prepilin-type N-terminal cleavage/methylation domain-containing protein
MKRRRYSGRSGMTLIELVVALTISGFALAAGYSTYGTLADRRAIADERADSATRSAAVRATLVTWLSNARLTVEEDEIVFRGVGGMYRSADGDLDDADVTFFTSAPTAVGNSGTIVHLFVGRDTISERGLVADLSEWRGQRHARVLLDRSIGGLQAAYLSSVLGRREWLPSWISSTILPAGVRITVSARTGETVSALLRPQITVSLDNGR